MARDLKELLVIDLEASCWEDGQQPADQVMEIIEFGITRIDLKTLDILSTDSILVKPTKSEISDFCTKLTTITPEMLKDAKTYPEVIAEIQKKFKPRDKGWASWGDYDRKQIEKNNKLYNLDYKGFTGTHTNFKNQFSVLEGLPYEMGMEKALEHLGIPLEGTHHRAGPDSHNIAKIIAYCLNKYRK